MSLAAHAPTMRDESILMRSVERSRLIAEFGPPLRSTLTAASRTDIFEYRQTQQTASDLDDRVQMHGALDYMTLGMWEVIGTPMELASSSGRRRLEVSYDTRDRVVAWRFLDGKLDQ